MIIDFGNSRLAWGTDRFNETFKNEFRTLAGDLLTQYVKSTQGGQFDFSGLTISVLSTKDNNEAIELTVSVFFEELLAGCNCDDDPTAVNIWARLAIKIKKSKAATFVSLVEQSG